MAQQGVENFIRKFSVCVGIIASFYAAPWIIKALRNDMHAYLTETIGYELAYYGSLFFVGAAIFAVFFACAAVFQLMLNGLIKKLSNRSAF